MGFRDRIKRMIVSNCWIMRPKFEVEIMLESYINKLQDEIAKNIKHIDLLQKRSNILEANVKALQGAI